MAQAEKGRKPDFNLSALNKSNDARAVVGYGWKNDNGSIGITLNAFAVIKGKGHGEDLALTLFPNQPMAGASEDARIEEGNRKAAEAAEHDKQQSNPI